MDQSLTPSMVAQIVAQSEIHTVLLDLAPCKQVTKTRSFFKRFEATINDLSQLEKAQEMSLSQIERLKMKEY